MALPEIDYGTLTKEETDKLAHEVFSYLSIDQIIEIVKENLTSKNLRRELIAKLEG